MASQPTIYSNLKSELLGRQYADTYKVCQEISSNIYFSTTHKLNNSIDVNLATNHIITVKLVIENCQAILLSVSCLLGNFARSLVN